MSTFIQKTDYLHKIKTARLDQIVSNDDTLLDKAEEDAIQRVKDSLYSRYKTEEIFAQTGNDRNRTIVRLVCSLVMYYICERIPDKHVPPRIIKNYDDAIEELTRIEDGKKEVDLPRLSDDDGNEITRFRFGSITPRTY